MEEQSDILKKKYRVRMPDGSIWAVPVEVIAKNRAEYYAKNDPAMEGDFGKSLREDTIPLFEGDFDEIEDWAKNNMEWMDVVDSADCVIDAPTPDFEDGWTNGEASVN